MNEWTISFQFSNFPSQILICLYKERCPTARGAAPTPVWTGPTVLSLFVLFVFFFYSEREFKYNIKPAKSVWIFHKNPSMSKELGALPKVLLPSSPVLQYFLNMFFFHATNSSEGKQIILVQYSITISPRLSDAQCPKTSRGLHQLPSEPVLPYFPYCLFVIIDDLSFCYYWWFNCCKKEIVGGRNLTVVAQWWTLCVGHLLKVHFCLCQGQL